MRLFALLLLFSSFAAHAQDRYNRAITRCYTDLQNKCVITLMDEQLGIPVGIVTNREEMNPSAEWIAELLKAGIAFQAKEPAEFRSLLAMSSDTKYVQMEEEIIGFTQIPDEQWSFYLDTTGCGVGALVCGTSLWATYMTGGAAYIAAGASCAYTGYQCVSAWRSWEKWQNYQIRKRNELRKKGIHVPIPGQASTSGSSIGVGGGSGPANGGTSEPVFEKCVTSTVGMGGGPKGEWLEESSTDCYVVN